jgi:predicted MPP superfamily phosphohydrolase
MPGQGLRRIVSRGEGSSALGGASDLIDSLVWLHVSDFHFVARGDEFSQRVAAEALLDDVPTRVAEAESVAFVLVTGDVAFSGRPEEYERAGEFLSQLATVVDVPPERFYFVPGNHDVDRTKHRLAYGGACSEVTSQAAVDRVLGSADDLHPLVDRQGAFAGFVDGFTGAQERAKTADGLGYVAVLALGGLKLAIMGLNSAWLSGRDAEEMKLVIGERQIINALELAEASNAQIQIAMAHHPVEWLQEWDQTSCQHRLLPEIHFYHRGHLHMAEVSLSSSPERPCVTVAAGSGHATRFYTNSYNVVELDLGAGAYTVRSFSYDPQAGRYEPGPVVSAHVVLRGSLPGTPAELAQALAANVPSAEPYAGYFADLITGQKEEIPVDMGDTVEFWTPAVAEGFAPGTLNEATAFLRLRGLLRLYDENVPLAERVGEHGPVIEGFATYVSRLADRDKRSAERVRGHQPPVMDGASESTGSRLPHTAQFLADLRNRGDWALLATQAQRFVDSADGGLARFAKAALAEALMHSDETEQRTQAAQLAGELATGPEASAANYLLAAAALETMGDDARAIDLTKEALTRWPDEEDVREYARRLTLRTGDIELRAAAENAAKGRMTS